jgi:hypothetical protein
MKTQTLKSFLADLSRTIGSGAIVRFALREKIAISAASPTSLFFSDFPFEIEGQLDEVEDFQLPLEALMSAVTTESVKRPASLKAHDSTLVVKTARATLELATSMAPEVLTEAPVVEGPVAEFIMTDDLHLFFKELLPVLGMEKIHDAQADFRLYVHMNAKIVFTSVYSSQQVAYVATENTFGIEADFNVPYTSFSSVHKVAIPGSKVTVGEDRILVENNSFTLMTLVSPLSPKEPPGELVHAKSKEITKSHMKAGHLSVLKPVLEEFLASCKGVVPDDSPVVFSWHHHQLFLTVDTSVAKAKFRTTKAEGNLSEEFALELRLLKNVTQKAGEKLDLYYADGVLFALSGAVGLITTTHVAR